MSTNVSVFLELFTLYLDLILKLVTYPILTTILIVEFATKAGEGGRKENTFGFEHLLLFKMEK